MHVLCMRSRERLMPVEDRAAYFCVNCLVEVSYAMLEAGVSSVHVMVPRPKPVPPPKDETKRGAVSLMLDTAGGLEISK